MNKTAQHMLLYSSIFIIIIGISLFLLAVVLALTIFVATNYYLRNTRYVYHDDVRANTFDFKVGVKWVI